MRIHLPSAREPAPPQPSEVVRSLHVVRSCSSNEEFCSVVKFLKPLDFLSADVEYWTEFLNHLDGYIQDYIHTGEGSDLKLLCKFGVKYDEACRELSYADKEQLFGTVAGSSNHFTGVNRSSIALICELVGEVVRHPRVRGHFPFTEEFAFLCLSPDVAVVRTSLQTLQQVVKPRNGRPNRQNRVYGHKLVMSVSRLLYSVWMSILGERPNMIPDRDLAVQSLLSSNCFRVLSEISSLDRAGHTCIKSLLEHALSKPTPNVVEIFAAAVRELNDSVAPELLVWLWTAVRMLTCLSNDSDLQSWGEVALHALSLFACCTKNETSLQDIASSTPSIVDQVSVILVNEHAPPKLKRAGLTCLNFLLGRTATAEIAFAGCGLHTPTGAVPKLLADAVGVLRDATPALEYCDLGQLTKVPLSCLCDLAVSLFDLIESIAASNQGMSALQHAGLIREVTSLLSVKFATVEDFDKLSCEELSRMRDLEGVLERAVRIIESFITGSINSGRDAVDSTFCSNLLDCLECSMPLITHARTSGFKYVEAAGCAAPALCALDGKLGDDHALLSAQKGLTLQMRERVVEGILQLVYSLLSATGTDLTGQTVLSRPLMDMVGSILECPHLYPPSQYVSMESLLMEMIYQDPTILPTVYDKNLHVSLARSFSGDEVNADGDVVLMYPQAMCALCMNPRGIEEMRPHKIFTVLRTLLDKRCISVFAEGDTARRFGANFDELLRHVPTLRVEGLRECIAVMKDLRDLLSQPKGSLENVSDLLHYVHNVCNFVCGLLNSTSQTTKEFVDAGGLEALCDLSSSRSLGVSYLFTDSYQKAVNALRLAAKINVTSTTSGNMLGILVRRLQSIIANSVHEVRPHHHQDDSELSDIAKEERDIFSMALHTELDDMAVDDIVVELTATQRIELCGYMMMFYSLTHSGNRNGDGVDPIQALKRVGLKGVVVGLASLANSLRLTVLEEAQSCYGAWFHSDEAERDSKPYQSRMEENIAAFVHDIQLRGLLPTKLQPDEWMHGFSAIDEPFDETLAINNQLSVCCSYFFSFIGRYVQQEASRDTSWNIFLSRHDAQRGKELTALATRISRYEGIALSSAVADWNCIDGALVRSGQLYLKCVLHEFLGITVDVRSSALSLRMLYMMYKEGVLDTLIQLHKMVEGHIAELTTAYSPPYSQEGSTCSTNSSSEESKDLDHVRASPERSGRQRPTAVYKGKERSLRSSVDSEMKRLTKRVRRCSASNDDISQSSISQCSEDEEPDAVILRDLESSWSLLGDIVSCMSVFAQARPIMEAKSSSRVSSPSEIDSVLRQPGPWVSSMHEVIFDKLFNDASFQETLCTGRARETPDRISEAGSRWLSYMLGMLSNVLHGPDTPAPFSDSAPTTSSLEDEAFHEGVNQIVEMGFAKRHAVRAMKRSGNDKDAAIILLLADTGSDGDSDASVPEACGSGGLDLETETSYTLLKAMLAIVERFPSDEYVGMLADVFSVYIRATPNKYIFDRPAAERAAVVLQLLGEMLDSSGSVRYCSIACETLRVLGTGSMRSLFCTAEVFEFVVRAVAKCRRSYTRTKKGSANDSARCRLLGSAVLTLRIFSRDQLKERLAQSGSLRELVASTYAMVSSESSRHRHALQACSIDDKELKLSAQTVGAVFWLYEECLALDYWGVFDTVAGSQGGSSYFDIAIWVLHSVSRSRVQSLLCTLVLDPLATEWMCRNAVRKAFASLGKKPLDEMRIPEKDFLDRVKPIAVRCGTELKAVLDKSCAVTPERMVVLRDQSILHAEPRALPGSIVVVKSLLFWLESLYIRYALVSDSASMEEYGAKFSSGIRVKYGNDSPSHDEKNSLGRFRHAVLGWTEDCSGFFFDTSVLKDDDGLVKLRDSMLDSIAACLDALKKVLSMHPSLTIHAVIRHRCSLAYIDDRSGVSDGTPFFRFMFHALLPALAASTGASKNQQRMEVANRSLRQLIHACAVRGGLSSCRVVFAEAVSLLKTLAKGMTMRGFDPHRYSGALIRIAEIVSGLQMFRTSLERRMRMRHDSSVRSRKAVRYASQMEGLMNASGLGPALVEVASAVRALQPGSMRLGLFDACEQRMKVLQGILKAIEGQVRIAVDVDLTPIPRSMRKAIELPNAILFKYPLCPHKPATAAGVPVHPAQRSVRVVTRPTRANSVTSTLSGGSLAHQMRDGHDEDGSDADFDADDVDMDSRSDSTVRTVATTMTTMSHISRPGTEVLSALDDADMDARDGDVGDNQSTIGQYSLRPSVGSSGRAAGAVEYTVDRDETLSMRPMSVASTDADVVSVDTDMYDQGSVADSSHPDTIRQYGGPGRSAPLLRMSDYPYGLNSRAGLYPEGSDLAALDGVYGHDDMDDLSTRGTRTGPGSQSGYSSRAVSEVGSDDEGYPDNLSTGSQDVPANERIVLPRTRQRLPAPGAPDDDVDSSDHEEADIEETALLTQDSVADLLSYFDDTLPARNLAPVPDHDGDDSEAEEGGPWATIVEAATGGPNIVFFDVGGRRIGESLLQRQAEARRSPLRGTVTRRGPGPNTRVGPRPRMLFVAPGDLDRDTASSTSNRARNGPGSHQVMSMISDHIRNELATVDDIQPPEPSSPEEAQGESSDERTGINAASGDADGMSLGSATEGPHVHQSIDSSPDSAPEDSPAETADLLPAEATEATVGVSSSADEATVERENGAESMGDIDAEEVAPEGVEGDVQAVAGADVDGGGDEGGGDEGGGVGDGDMNISSESLDPELAEPEIEPLDPDVLVALPDDLREEVLRDHERQVAARAERIAAARQRRERIAAGAAPEEQAGPSDMDASSFIATLPPELRAEILMTSDQAVIETLSPEMRAEALNLRSNAMPDPLEGMANAAIRRLQHRMEESSSSSQFANEMSHTSMIAKDPEEELSKRPSPLSSADMDSLVDIVTGVPSLGATASGQMFEHLLKHPVARQTLLQVIFHRIRSMTLAEQSSVGQLSQSEQVQRANTMQRYLDLCLQLVRSNKRTREVIVNANSTSSDPISAADERSEAMSSSSSLQQQHTAATGTAEGNDSSEGSSLVPRIAVRGPDGDVEPGESPVSTLLHLLAIGFGGSSDSVTTIHGQKVINVLVQILAVLLESASITRSRTRHSSHSESPTMDMRGLDQAVAQLDDKSLRRLISCITTTSDSLDVPAAATNVGKKPAATAVLGILSRIYVGGMPGQRRRVMAILKSSLNSPMEDILRISRQCRDLAKTVRGLDASDEETRNDRMQEIQTLSSKAVASAEAVWRLSELISDISTCELDHLNSLSSKDGEPDAEDGDAGLAVQSLSIPSEHVMEAFLCRRLVESLVRLFGEAHSNQEHLCRPGAPFLAFTLPLFRAMLGYYQAWAAWESTISKITTRMSVASRSSPIMHEAEGPSAAQRGSSLGSVGTTASMASVQMGSVVSLSEMEAEYTAGDADHGDSVRLEDLEQMGPRMSLAVVDEWTAPLKKYVGRQKSSSTAHGASARNSSSGSSAPSHASAESAALKELRLLVGRLFFSSRLFINTVVSQQPTLLMESLKLLVHVPRFLSFENKRNWFRQQIRRRRSESGHEGVHINVRRDSVLLDAYHTLRQRNSDELRGHIQVRFQGEEGVDAGGLTREWFTLIAREIANPNYCLFTRSVDQSSFQPHSASYVNPEHLNYFHLIGRLCGLAIINEYHMDVHFTRSMYKHILKKKITFHDIDSIDPEYYSNLKWMLENDITDVLDLTFTGEYDHFGEHKVVELVSGGKDIAVTEKNKLEYVQRVTELRMTTGIKKQLQHFLKGFYEIVPPELVAIFDEQELELLLAGMPDISMDDLRSNVEYHGYTVSSPVIQWFWEVVDKFSKEDKAKLLQFVTGSSKVPLDGFQSLMGMNGRQKFNIHRVSGPTAVERLPTAHTCFNQLDLPEYESLDQLRERLTMAITECTEGFGFV